MAADVPMQLREALEINREPRDGMPFRGLLACGSTTLHLVTFLSAQIRLRRTQSPVEIDTGLYDDLLGTLSGVRANSLPDGLFVLLEWPDLDPRLGLRQLGGWSPQQLPDLVASARTKLGLIEDALLRAGRECPTVLCPPLLELPPMFHTVRQQLHPHAAELDAQLAGFLARVTAQGIRVLHPGQFDGLRRFDPRSYLSTGSAYTVDFASVLARQLAEMLLPAAPKKGLITDLDDTLWRGILGDLGASNVAWDLSSKSQVHGIYQTLLQSLADAGVLIAVASKNDPANVQEALQRSDLLVSPKHLFPVDASWAPKSEAVSRILRTWNIGEDAVVFVDDSPTELAQVSQHFPSMTMLQFPTRDTAACWDLFGQLRDLFGKPALSTEDSIRVQSLREAAVREDALATSATGMDDFLKQSRGVLQIEHVHPDDARALELVNKTNQFNLNGRRWTEADWRRMLGSDATVALAVSYQDKYGPLGKIGVLAGERSGDRLRLHTWVMSCRAFSRRIEHQTVAFLFDEYEVSEIELDFEPTKKNGPLQQFLAEIAEAGHPITETSFRERCPLLVHSLERSTVHERLRT